MNTSDFCYWLSGFFTRQEVGDITTDDIKMIREKLEAAIAKNDSTKDIILSGKASTAALLTMM